MITNSTGFTVDLSTIVLGNNTTTGSITSQQIDRAARVRVRVAELIKPGVVYQLIDMDGELVGTIGDAKVERLGIDDELTDRQDGWYEISDCETIEDLDDYLFMLDVMDDIVNRVTQPPPDNDWGGGNKLQAQREWIQEQRSNEASIRSQILEDEAEENESAASNPNCTGYLDPSIGEVVHRSGVRCNIHQVNIT